MTDSNPLARFLVPLRRWWPIVVGAMALGLVIAWVTLPEPPETQPTPEELLDPTVEYRATHILIRDRPTAATSNFDLLLLLARQGDLANRIAEAMDGAVEVPDVEAVVLETDGNLGTLSITAVQPTPDLAETFATTYAEELTAFFDERAEISLQEQIDGATDRLATFDARIRDLEDEITALPEGDLDRRLLESELNVLIEQFGALQTELRDLTSQQISARSTFETLQPPAAVSTAATFENPVFEVPENSPARFAIAAFLALLLGIAVIFAVDYLDTRIRTRQDAEDAFGLPVIAELPRRTKRELKSNPLAVHHEPSSATAEAFRSLRLSVLLARRWRLDREAPTSSGSVGTAAPVADGAAPKTLLITSSLTGEGKSTVTANLAVSLAESGQRVLVVDCDFRRSTVPELLGVAAGPGLRELTSPTPGSVARLVRPSAIEGVSVVRAGEPGLAPAWFLANSDAIVEQAAAIADIVVFDTGPLMVTNEAVSLIPSVDAVLLVNRAGKLGKDQARRTTEQLSRVSAEVAGVVMVAGEGPRRYGYYEPIRKASAKGESVETWAAGNPNKL